MARLPALFCNTRAWLRDPLPASLPLRMPRTIPANRGQAAVELVAVLPLLVMLAVAGLQVVLGVHAAWAAEQAARSAARAGALGLDARKAALRALPDHLERGLRVRADPGGRVEVRLRVPVVLQPLDPGDVTARAAFEEQS